MRSIHRPHQVAYCSEMRSKRETRAGEAVKNALSTRPVRGGRSAGAMKPGPVGGLRTRRRALRFCNQSGKCWTCAICIPGGGPRRRTEEEESSGAPPPPPPAPLREQLRERTRAVRTASDGSLCGAGFVFNAVDDVVWNKEPLALFCDICDYIL